MVAGAQAELLADRAQLPLLCLLQRVALLPQRAGVGHRLVEEQPVQVVAEVVVVLDVRPGLAQPLPTRDVGAVAVEPGKARARAPGLEVAHDERDQAGEVVGVPVARGVGLAEAEAGRARDAAEDVVRRDGDDDRVARPGPMDVPAREAQLQCAVLDPAERPDRSALGEAGPDPAAGGKLAQYLGHRFTDPSPGTNGGLWKNGTRFSQSRRCLEVDQDGHPERHQRVAKQRPGEGRARQRPTRPGERGEERPRAALAEVDPHVESLTGLGEPPLVALLQAEERRDVELLVVAVGEPALARVLVLGREEVGEPLAEGVADLGDDAGELAALVAVEEADRVEDVAEDAQVRQEQDPVGLDPVLGEVGADVEVIAVVQADDVPTVPAEQAHAPVELR